MTYSKLHISSSVGLHSLTSIDCIGPADHFDERMALVGVDDARLNDAKFAEQ